MSAYVGGDTFINEINGSFYEQSKYLSESTVNEELFRKTSNGFESAGFFETQKEKFWFDYKLTDKSPAKDMRELVFSVNLNPVTLFYKAGLIRYNPVFFKDCILSILRTFYPLYKFTCNRDEMHAYRDLVFETRHGLDIFKSRVYEKTARERFYEFGFLEKIYQYSVNGHSIWGMPSREIVLNFIPCEPSEEMSEEQKYNNIKALEIHKGHLTDIQKTDFLIRSINAQ